MTVRLELFAYIVISLKKLDKYKIWVNSTTRGKHLS